MGTQTPGVPNPCQCLSKFSQKELAWLLVFRRDPLSKFRFIVIDQIKFTGTCVERQELLIGS